MTGMTNKDVIELLDELFEHANDRLFKLGKVVKTYERVEAAKKHLQEMDSKLTSTLLEK